MKWDADFSLRYLCLQKLERGRCVVPRMDACTTAEGCRMVQGAVAGWRRVEGTETVSR